MYYDSQGREIEDGEMDNMRRDAREQQRHIDAEDYQTQALRTMRPKELRDKLLLCGFGLAGESGEVIDLLKKYLFNGAGIELPREKLKEELGDLLWYFTNLCTALDIALEDVMRSNIDKLQQRHPNGFTPRYESDSHIVESPTGTEPCYICNTPVASILGPDNEVSYPACEYCQGIICPICTLTAKEGITICCDTRCIGASNDVEEPLDDYHGETDDIHDLVDSPEWS